MQNPPRQSNFELLRIVCVLMILLTHCYGRNLEEPMNAFNTLPTEMVVPLASVNVMVGQFVAAAANVGVTVFILISGYFGVKLNVRKFVHLVWLTTLYAVVVCIVQHGLADGPSLGGAMLSVPLYRPWFIACYLVLMLLSPWLNEWMGKISERSARRLLVVLTVLFCILPTAFHTQQSAVIIGGGKNLSYFIYIYFVGRYIRLHRDISIPLSRSLGTYALMTAVVMGLDVAASHVHGRTIRPFAYDNSIFIFISSLALFFAFKGMRFQSRAVNYVASSVVAVYLLDGLRDTVDKHIITWSDKAADNTMAVYMAGGALATFALAVVADKLRGALLGRWEDAAIGRAVAWIKIIGNRNKTDNR